jgi:hypothetical protein
MVGSGGPPIPEKEAKGDDGTRPGGVGTAGDGSVQSGKAAVDERLAERRRSFAPMSSMEEENLRERLHLAQLRQCSEIVSAEQKYTRDTFRRLFQGKVGPQTHPKFSTLPKKTYIIFYATYTQ